VSSPPREASEMDETAVGAIAERRTLILMGRVAEYGGSEHVLRAAGVLAKLQLGVAARSSIVESCDPELVRTVEAADDLLNGKAESPDGGALLIAASWCLAELACLVELDREAQVARRGVAGEILTRIRGVEGLPKALATDLERALIG